ncbi:MAG: CoB--CoM heterodisulfide reductase iron-sulfur subunit B family protein [Candidatus Methanospirareceae archaeon]
MKYAYYPGCSNHASSKDYEMSIRAVCEKLGKEVIELEEIEDWNCCAAAEATNQMLSYALSIRNLAIAEKKGLDLVASCSGCYFNFSKAYVAIREEKGLREKMREIDPCLDYRGEIKPRHLLDVIVNDIGVEELAKKVEKKVNVKVASYYGCMVGRSRLPFDDPDDPQCMDRLARAVGAEPIRFYYKAKCCGGPILLTNMDVALEMTRKILQAAKDGGAECIITACPFCELMLDAMQKQIESKYNIEIGLPVLYFTQLLGLALGIEPKKLGLKKLAVPADEIIKKVV